MTSRNVLQKQAIKSDILQEQATILLRKHGYTWSGRSRKDLTSETASQNKFERKIISAGHCGKSTRC